MTMAPIWGIPRVAAFLLSGDELLWSAFRSRPEHLQGCRSVSQGSHSSVPLRFLGWARQNGGSSQAGSAPRPETQGTPIHSQIGLPSFWQWEMTAYPGLIPGRDAADIPASQARPRKTRWSAPNVVVAAATAGPSR